MRYRNMYAYQLFGFNEPKVSKWEIWETQILWIMDEYGILRMKEIFAKNKNKKLENRVSWLEHGVCMGPKRIPKLLLRGSGYYKKEGDRNYVVIKN